MNSRKKVRYLLGIIFVAALSIQYLTPGEASPKKEPSFKTYLFDGFQAAWDIGKSEDGYIVLMVRGIESDNISVSLVMVSSKGEIVWETPIGSFHKNCVSGEWSCGVRHLTSKEAFISNVLVLKDGTYLVAWRQKDGIDSLVSAKLTHVGKDGKIILEKTYRSDTDLLAGNIISLRNGGYLIAYTSMKESGGDAGLIKLDEDFNKIWIKSYDGGGDFEFIHDVIELKDGGYVIKMYSRGHRGEKGDLVIVKVNKDGKEIWNKPIGSVEDDIPSTDGMILGTNGKIYISAMTRNEAGETPSVICMDENGETLWETEFGFPGEFSAQRI